MNAAELNLALMGLPRRAEKLDAQRLVDTFVSVGAVFTRLSTRDHQVLYGRRGTGKTHALQYLARKARTSGEMAVYVDLQTVGSSGGFYSDPTVSVADAGTRLLVDTLGAIQDQLVDQVLFFSDAARGTHTAPGGATMALLDRLAGDILEVEVGGAEEERTLKTVEEGGGASNYGVSAKLDLGGGAGMNASLGGSRHEREVKEMQLLIKGAARHNVRFGRVGRTLQQLIAELPEKKLWILLDEWTDIPLPLQPLLADLLRRCLFPVRGLTVKIGAIEQRSRFWLDRPEEGYLGIELGADAAADVDLDDFMVFGNQPDSAVSFFAQLLHRHAKALLPEALQWPDEELFVESCFVNRDAFKELVRAAEGVPRDAIHILSQAALIADDRKIRLQDVRSATRTWYQRDKEKPLATKPAARDLLHWVVDEVIDQRRSRGFLIQQGTDHDLIDWLYDARLLHVIKRGIASKSHPGVRFDAYTLDYGCYIELITTSRAPQGLLETTDEAFVDTPPDDADLVRNSILDLEDFVDPRKPLTTTALPTRWLRRQEFADEYLEHLPRPGVWLLFELEDEVAAVLLPKGRTVIGCGRDCDVRLAHHSVGPRHANLLVDEAEQEQLSVTGDRENPLYVNNQRTYLASLHDGDRLKVGKFAAHVVRVPPAQTEAA